VSISAALALCLAVFQILDVNEDVLQELSPEALVLHRQFLPADERIAVPELRQISSERGPATLSVYAPATRKELAIFLCGLTVLVLAYQLFADSRTLLWLSALLVLNGAAIAYFGIVQQLSWNGQLYWRVPIEGTSPFGPFINRNGAGGYLVLCLSGAIPLLTWAISRGWSATKSRVNFSRGPNALVLGVLVMTGVLAGGVLAAMSRGAWLAAVVGTIAVVGLIGWRHLRRNVLIGVLAASLVPIGLLGWLSMSGPVGDRIASLSTPGRSLNGRWELWLDALRIVPDFWRLGTGLGTFGLVQPQYQSQPMLVWYDQAENLYLQALVEMGLPGGLLLVSMLLLALAGLWPAVRRSTDPQVASFAAMGIYAICSQATSAFFDFSLQYPANQFALAIVVGGTLGYSRQLRSHDLRPISSNIVTWTRTSAVVFVHLLLIAGVLVAWREMVWTGGIDLAVNRGEMEVDESKFSSQEINDGLESLEVLLKHRPDDAEGQLRYAALQVVKYRQAAFNELKKQFGNDLEEQELWRFTSPMVLHARASEFARRGDSERLADLRSMPVIREHLEPALHHVLLARQSGPLLGRSHQLLAQLWFLAGDPLDDEPHVARAVRIAPQDPQVQFWAGEMQLQSGRLNEACSHWRRSLELSASFDEPVLAHLDKEIPAERFVDEVLPDSPAVLVRIADQLEAAAIADKLGPQLGPKLLRAVETQPATPPAAYWKARGFQLSGDAASALPYFEDATTAHPLNIEWRLQKARALRDVGQKRQAVREAELCVRLSSHNVAAKELLNELIQAEVAHQ